MSLFNVGEVSEDVYYDEYLGSRYQTARANAKSVRTYLLSNLKQQKINPLDYSVSGIGVEAKPDIEIYEYQPFYLLKRLDGTYGLLDGFRRLIYYDAPDHMINIRIYHEKDLTSQQIMKLMIYLNHFKFFGGGKYYDRGFALSMKTIFGLEIPNYHTIFNSYLTCENEKRDYSMERVSGGSEQTRVKDRMLNPMFVSDMKFIEQIKKHIPLNYEFGPMIYNLREEHPDKEFDGKFFVKKVKSNKLLLKLQEKFKGYRSYDTGLRAQDVVNEMMSFYKNIFIEMFGGKVEKTYTQLLDDAKLKLKEVRKDKTYVKITGIQNTFLLNQLILRRHHKGLKTKFKCIVYPEKPDQYSWGNEERVLVDLDVNYLEGELEYIERHQHLLKVTHYWGLPYKGIKFKFTHNYSTYGWGKQYTSLVGQETYGKTYKVDLFVDLDKKDIEDLDGKRNNWVE